MVLKRQSEADHAEAMGRRAGVDLVRFGAPTRNPFARDVLRRRWARGYAAGAALPTRGRSEGQSAGGPSRGAAG